MTMQRAQVSIPGKVMLAGEYAVLQGGATLSTTISGALTVEVTYGNTGETRVSSDIWLDDITLLATARVEDYQHDPLCQAILAGRKLYNVNADCVKVTSNLDVRHGVGTSSAIRLGVLMGMQAISNPAIPSDRWEIARAALDLQRHSQPDASGYDFATQLNGGLLRLEFGSNRSEPKWFSQIEQLGQEARDRLTTKVHLFVGGKGAPTARVMQTTLQWIADNDLDQEIYAGSERLVTAFEAALREDSLAHDQLLFAQMGNFRKIFTASPEFPRNIADKVSACKNCDRSWSFKTTGAGGEDALLVAGKNEDLGEVFAILEGNGWQPMPYEFTDQGAVLSLVEAS